MSDVDIGAMKRTRRRGTIGQLEAKSVALKELTAELHQTCYTLVKDKISGAQANAKYRRACDMGAFSSDAYIDGLEHGRTDCGALGVREQKSGAVRR